MLYKQTPRRFQRARAVNASEEASENASITPNLAKSVALLIIGLLLVVAIASQPFRRAWPSAVLVVRDAPLPPPMQLQNLTQPSLSAPPPPMVPLPPPAPLPLTHPLPEPPRRTPPPPPPQYLLAVIVQGPIYNTALGGFSDSVHFSPLQQFEGPVLPILSTTSGQITSELLPAYQAAGFHVLVTTEADVPMPRGTFPGSQRNSNWQRATTIAGLLFAASRGATHAIKMRGDFVITNFTQFREIAGFPLQLHCLWWYDGGPAGGINGRPLPPSPADQLFYGPIDHMIDMFTGWQDGPEFDTRLPELSLFDGYCARRNLTRLACCQEMPALGLLLPDGLCFYAWKGIYPPLDCNFMRKGPAHCRTACDPFTCPPYKDIAEFPSDSITQPSLSR